MIDRAVLAVLVAAFAPACSFALSGPPSPYSPDRPPRCDTGRAAPVADTVGATLFGAAAVFFLIPPSHDSCSGNDGCGMFDGAFQTLGAILLIPTAFYAGAATVGFVQTSRCRDAFDRHQAYRARRSSQRGP